MVGRQIAIDCFSRKASCSRRKVFHDGNLSKPLPRAFLSFIDARPRGPSNHPSQSLVVVTKTVNERSSGLRLATATTTTISYETESHVAQRSGEIPTAKIFPGPLSGLGVHQKADQLEKTVDSIYFSKLNEIQ